MPCPARLKATNVKSTSHKPQLIPSFLSNNQFTPLFLWIFPATCGAVKMACFGAPLLQFDLVLLLLSMELLGLTLAGAGTHGRSFDLSLIAQVVGVCSVDCRMAGHFHQMLDCCFNTWKSQ